MICLDTKVCVSFMSGMLLRVYSILLLTILFTIIKDNPHEAKLQGRVALELCWILEQTNDLDLEAPELVEQFQEEQMTHTQIKVLHQICYL